ncbi:MAG: radical SAM domain-containing protein [Desulfobacterales bacterium]
MTKNRPHISEIAPEIIAEKQGATEYTKISYPLRYGCYGQIRTRDYIFQFNRNGEIKTIQGRSGDWLTSSEWLKRTAGNDWQYFSAGGYSGAYNYTGEYYIPCLPYQTNTLFGGDAFQRPEVRDAFAALDRLYRQIDALDLTGLDRAQAEFIRRIRQMTPETLESRGRRLHEIIGGMVSVLPPDARHVEYDIIPVTVADGCLYNCGFCRVKTGRGFSIRSRQSVIDQLTALKQFYDRDLVNYNAVFLGQHDALNAGRETLMFAAEKAWEILEISKSTMKGPRIFLFGSADSVLRADDALFDELNSLPFTTYINLGLESGDGPTLSMLRKPLSPAKVEEAFARMLAVNRQYPNIEITANFVIGEDLPETHLSSIIGLTRNRLDRFCPKGAAYLSPLENIGDKNRLLTKFNELKTLCRLPAYIYLIQRL